MLLFSMLSVSTALGNHLDSPSASSHSDTHDQPKQDQNNPAIKHLPPNPPTSSHRQSEPPAANQSPPVITTAEQRIRKAKPYTAYAWRLILKGRYKAAVGAYQQAIKKNPTSAPSYVGLGIALTNTGNLDTAKKAFLKAIDLDSQLSSALVHLGYLYAHGSLGQAEPETAIRLFRQASQLGDPFADIALLDMKL